MANEVVSIAQFREAINNMAEYVPYRGRNIDQHAAAELYDDAGNRITGLKVKLYIQDDGGNWTRDGLIKPEFIWDTKKISGNSIVDSGNHTYHDNLLGSNVIEYDDGTYFLNKSNSHLKSQNLNDITTFNSKSLMFNIWFRIHEPIQDEEFGELLLFKINKHTADDDYSPKSSNGEGVLTVSLGYDETNATFTPHITIHNADGDAMISHSCRDIKFNDLNNLQFILDYNIVGVNTGYTFNSFVNGFIEPEYTGTITTPVYSGNYFIEMGTGFKGEIMYAALNIVDEATPLSTDMFEKQYLFKYPLPRSKEWVDFSDDAEKKGQNLFIEASQISKVIENLRGQLFVKTNSIKVKDG